MSYNIFVVERINIFEFNSPGSWDRLSVCAVDCMNFLANKQFFLLAELFTIQNVLYGHEKLLIAEFRYIPKQ